MQRAVSYKQNIESDSISVCHGCLVTGVKLFDMVDYKLRETYSDLIGRKIDKMDIAPQYMCSFCTKHLINFNAFRSRCIRTQELLENAHQKNMLTPEYIQQIDRAISGLVLPYTTTPINMSNYIINKVIEENSEMYDNKGLRKDDQDIDIIKCENYEQIEKDLKYDEYSQVENVEGKYTKTETTYPTNINFSEVNLVDSGIVPDKNFNENTFEDTDVIKCEINEDAEIYLKEDRYCEFGNAKDTFKKSDNDNSKINFSEVNLLDSKMVVDGNLENSKTDIVQIKYAKKRIHKNNSNIKTKQSVSKSNVRCKKLGKKLNVVVKLLSKEEQIGELENRKLSSNYKQATYKCNLCYKGYVVENTYKSHMALHSPSSGDLICDICKCRFKTKATLALHLKTHEMILTCRDCGHISTQIRMATLHFKFHQGAKYPCQFCPKVYDRRTTYYWHMKAAHASSLVRCELCGDAFNGAFGLKAHERRTHTIPSDCVCTRCDLQFYTKEAFDAHRTNDDGHCNLELKSCVRCGATFATTELLVQHELEQQRLGGNFECLLCNKKFHTLDYYKKHHLNSHAATKDSKRNCRPVRAGPRDVKINKDKTGSSSLLCEICGKTTKNSGLLKLHHLAKHSTKDLWPYQCNVCPKSFHALALLQDHIRTHTGERPFRCQLCPKAFNCKQNLKRHNIVHTGERPYKCHVCEKKFQTSSCVKVHVKTVHMKVPQPSRIRKKKVN